MTTFPVQISLRMSEDHLGSALSPLIRHDKFNIYPIPPCLALVLFGRNALIGAITMLDPGRCEVREDASASQFCTESRQLRGKDRFDQLLETRGVSVQIQRRFRSTKSYNIKKAFAFPEPENRSSKLTWN